jgi:glycosyltransferase involved in cell wall biosynthesis
MIEGRTILCFASGYDAPPTSKHHVIHVLAQKNTVLLVNYHASRVPKVNSSDLAYMVSRLRHMLGGLKNPKPNLYVMTPLIIPLPGLGLAKRFNRWLLTVQIGVALKGLRNGPLQIWAFAPDISYVLGHFGEEKVVYYCVDEFSLLPGYDRDQVLRDEADLCRKADLVVTTAMALQEAKASLNPNTILVSHAVDYEHFSRAMTEDLVVPEDIAGIPRPILGFFGLIRDWVDLGLLAGVARRRPDWHIVLLGDSTVDLAPYRPLANMHFLGRKPYGQLPAYCRCFDVGIIPFKINDLTRAVNPMKLREYLAAGLPVVSTPLPEVAVLREHVKIAATVDEFVAAVASCLTEGRDLALQRSRSMARETWTEKVNMILQHLENGRSARRN